jgi:hypothetical protein
MESIGFTTFLVETEQARETRWRFRIFAAASVLYAAYYFCRKNFSVVMPMMARTSHFGNFDLAQLVFAFSLAYAVGQFSAGALGDRFGGRLTGVLGGLVSAACTAEMAAVAKDHRVLLLQIGNGLGQGCAWSACLKVLAAWFERKERGRVMVGGAPAMCSEDSWLPSSLRSPPRKCSSPLPLDGEGASCSLPLSSVRLPPVRPLLAEHPDGRGPAGQSRGGAGCP